ncbi:MAG: DEAD/DEAH box helicase [Salibacteraceae bacterium]
MEQPVADKLEQKEGRELYRYQQEALDQILGRINNAQPGYNLLYQLPTGGGKTVIFSEITRQYIENTGKKVIILTHRIELCGQTSRVLSDNGVANKVINSQVKHLTDQEEYSCFVAMVETLNNRLSDAQFTLDNVGLVIVDEAHYNSFRKLFKFFSQCCILGVTATPLSSNIKMPMKDNYSELIVGDSIASLIEKGFLAKATTYGYDVKLGTLKVGPHGDYTVSSSELLYGNYYMQEKLLRAYEERAIGTKTLIFNNGINTSQQVYHTFMRAGYPVRHLDHSHGEPERREILNWFKTTKDAVLTSVSILTTGFDEPGVETVILNRATKSLTLYHQMIGRGSRVLPDKKAFTIIDLGNNARRFGLWEAFVDWQEIFRAPDRFLLNIVSDELIERDLPYIMPQELRERLSNTPDLDFDMAAEYKRVVNQGQRSKKAILNSVEQHAQVIFENSEDLFEARELIGLLQEEIEFRVKQYSYCITKSSDNYQQWLQEDYRRRLRNRLRERFLEVP